MGKNNYITIAESPNSLAMQVTMVGCEAQLRKNSLDLACSVADSSVFCGLCQNRIIQN